MSRGPAFSCVWGCESSRYEWTNLTGDYQNAEDYAQMCKKCHSRFNTSLKTMESDFEGFGYNKNRKLTEIVVKQARVRRSNGERLIDLAKEYGVANSTLSLAINGRQWRYA